MVSETRSSHTLDEICPILANQRRRQLLTYLSGKDTEIADLDEIVTHLTEEDDKALTAEQVRLSLVHTHIPKLADHGVIEYDRRNKDVRYRDGTKLEDFLEVLPTNTCSM